MQKQDVRFSLVSLGCARTLVDSENIVAQLRDSGFRWVPEGTNEHVTVLNTCSFIQAAVDETEENIRLLSERKENGEIRYLVVVGCYPSRFKKEVLKEKFPTVDLWLTTKEEDQIQHALSQMVFGSRFQPAKPQPHMKLTPSHYAYLKISEGCDNWCSFCTIPKIRGKHTSKPIPVIIEEIKKQVSFGTKEFNIIAEDTTAWGEDLYGKPDLPRLLYAIAEVPGVEWIRLMYIFPHRVDDALIAAIRDIPQVIPYLDMPVQHCNTRLLELMNRRYTGPDLDTLISKLYQEIPELVLRTSLILGFPTETEEEFAELMAFIAKYPFAQLGCFSYSEERETKSARLTPKISDTEIRSRIKRIMSAQRGILKTMQNSWKGQKVQMIYEGNGVGRSYREAPDVDGRLLVKNHEGLVSGQFYDVILKTPKGYDYHVEVCA